ncbi:DinB family protein [Micromonospora sp. 4G57]|uniref:DinB family protein n=1 Tax=Micromonospora sicca TaxID=2202420 RepID=A0ABU5JFI5_9ACTN|nr:MULTISPECIES: DinB family protein [unclassified Micromonospora]MDZ5445387.1 DinB family protein [Micromonospora sp. 4G57]MDZ5491204.1 DinB family protein [Micromonospora sp. 4G53]
MSVSEQVVTGERADLLATLRRHRGFLRQTVDGLTDEQAAQRSTVSELCLGGLIKHVTIVEQRWMRFAVGGAEAMRSQPVDWAGQFRMQEGETLAGLLDEFDRVARATDELVATLDLDTAHPLPTAPWFEPGASWSVRRVLLHVIAETAQHAGHADILRESIDGAKTMG